MGGRKGVHLPIPTGPQPAEVGLVIANPKTKGNPDSRIFMKADADLSATARKCPQHGQGLPVRE